MTFVVYFIEVCIPGIVVVFERKKNYAIGWIGAKVWTFVTYVRKFREGSPVRAYFIYIKIRDNKAYAISNSSLLPIQRNSENSRSEKIGSGKF